MPKEETWGRVQEGCKGKASIVLRTCHPSDKDCDNTHGGLPTWDVHRSLGVQSFSWAFTAWARLIERLPWSFNKVSSPSHLPPHSTSVHSWITWTTKTLLSLEKFHGFKDYFSGAEDKARLFLGSGQILYYTAWHRVSTLLMCMTIIINCPLAPIRGPKKQHFHPLFSDFLLWKYASIQKSIL